MGRGSFQLAEVEEAQEHQKILPMSAEASPLSSSSSSCLGWGQKHAFWSWSWGMDGHFCTSTFMSPDSVWSIRLKAQRWTGGCSWIFHAEHMLDTVGWIPLAIWRPWSSHEETQEVQTSKEHTGFSMQSHDYWAMKLVWTDTIHAVQPWGVKDGRTGPSESETHPQGFVGCLLLTMASFVSCWQPSEFRREHLPYYLKALKSTSPDGSLFPSVKNDLLCVLSL